MKTRRGLLAAGAASAATALVAAHVRGADLFRPSLAKDAGAGLRTYASRHDVAFGSATATYQLADLDFASAFSREADILVPEYEMKRSELEPQKGQYNFDPCDRLLAYAAEHGMEMRGHTLVWYASNPPWLEDEVLSTRKDRVMTDHIEAVMGRYRGRIRTWDVVNEALWPADGRPDGLRDNFWLKAFGENYIDLAYHAARASDPDAVLVYNDWGYEQGGPDNDKFRAVTLQFLERALARGVPIQALGIQGHLSAFGQPVDQKKLGEFLGSVRGMGLAVLVTEHDVYDGGGPSDVVLRDRAVADASRKFLDIVLERGQPSAVLTWGLTDKYLRPDSLKQRMLGNWPRKLPLDAELKRKPMWTAMRQAFS